MSFAYRRHPLKGLYVIYQLLTTMFVRIPWWILLTIPQTWRPRKSWTIKRTIYVRLLRHLMSVTSQTGPLVTVPNHLAITPGTGINGVWVGAVSHLIIGDLKTWRTTSSVASIRIPGYWVHKAGTNIKVASSPTPGEKVIYNLHGGAYVRLSAHPSDLPAAIVRGLLDFVEPVNRVFSIEYRLSSGKPFVVENPFPCALIDALAGYNYLVNVVGFSPADIVIVGDSAGGNLAHALTRYLVENQDSADAKLPRPPGALILLSPWSDLSSSHDTPGSSVFTCSNSDYILNDGDIAYAKRAFSGPHGSGATETNRYISPASKHPSLEVHFKGFPRTFIVSGGAELILDQIRTLKSRMIADLGEGDGVLEDEGKVRYLEAPDSVHDYIVFEWHEPERSDTLKEIAKWIAIGK
ncbi:hypothetical protein AMATHDRAFT_142257 [Amanita thiersii Skay4041]|uniref:Alpha/beta hydrolase fold-3 domain-containing protein n=1 Tax=Amanita thiersii Skay4041 TaxID=703135 RepID=A0A2A9NN79_9AGAR|nr:hypothetical protein AMATHDRAFT_142257 [Amanita thiersii Skay4041]